MCLTVTDTAGVVETLTLLITVFVNSLKRSLFGKAIEADANTRPRARLKARRLIADFSY